MAGPALGCQEVLPADHNLITRASADVRTVAVVNAVSAAEEVIQAGELVIRPAQYTVTARGRVVALSMRELALLVHLARHPGRVFARHDLYEDVWGEPYEPRDRSVDVYVHKVRIKLAEVLPEYVFIHTHHGLGYRFHPERSQDFHNSPTRR
jgi:DNA-binding response OmpR family regulator